LILTHPARHCNQTGQRFADRQHPRRTPYKAWVLDDLEDGLDLDSDTGRQ
jgi:hypothetical protein